MKLFRSTDNFENACYRTSYLKELIDLPEAIELRTWTNWTTYLKGSPRSRAPRRRWTRAGCRPAPSRSAPRPSPPRGSACPSWGWRSLPRAPPGCSGWPPLRPASALPATPRAGCRWSERGRNQGRKEMFYLTTHSTHFIYGYMVSDIWLRTVLIVRKETRWRHMGYSFRLATRVSFICTIPQTG